MVTGAFADTPPAFLAAAVAVNTSAAACPRRDAGVISKAPESAVAPIILYVPVIAHLSRTRLEFEE